MIPSFFPGITSCKSSAVVVVVGVTSVTKGNVHCRTLTVTVCEKIAGWSEL